MTGRSKEVPRQVDAKTYDSNAEFPAMLASVQNRLKWTYLARLEGSKRLQSCNTAISSGMVLFNLASVLSAIRMLTDDRSFYWPSSPYTSIAFAIIALSLSLYSATADYGRRGQRMFENYREIQKLWAETERLTANAAVELHDILKKYDDQLDGHENHSSGDYRIVRFIDSLRTRAEVESLTREEQALTTNEALVSERPAVRWRKLKNRLTGWVSDFYRECLKLHLLRFLSRLAWLLPVIAGSSVVVILATGYV